MVSIKEYEKKRWIKHWAGYWSVLSASYLGYQYTELLKNTLNCYLKKCIFISYKNFTVCYLEKKDHHNFGNELVK